MPFNHWDRQQISNATPESRKSQTWICFCAWEETGDQKHEMSSSSCFRCPELLIPLRLWVCSCEENCDWTACGKTRIHVCTCEGFRNCAYCVQISLIGSVCSPGWFVWDFDRPACSLKISRTQAGNTFSSECRSFLWFCSHLPMRGELVSKSKDLSCSHVLSLA